MPTPPKSDMIVWSPGPSSSSQPSQKRPKGLYETQDGLQLDTNVCFDPDDDGNTLWYQFSTRWDKRGQSVGEFVSTMYGSAETGQWGSGDEHYDPEDAKDAAEHHRRRVARALAARPRTAYQVKNAPSDGGASRTGSSRSR